MTEATFQQFLATFESFTSDLIRLWLLAYPQSLAGRKLDFSVVLEASDKDAVAWHVVDREVNQVFYDRPAGWFAYLSDRVGIDLSFPAEIEQFAEAKATRDILVHNARIVNEIYLTKVGRLARHKLGDRVDIPDPYHRATWLLVRGLVEQVSARILGKLG